MLHGASRMLDDQALFITQLVTLWAVLDPISHLPLFMGATTSLSDGEKRRAASIAVLLAFVILAIFGFCGQFLLHAMGISLLSFQIAGGIVLFLFAVSMVLGEAKHTPSSVPTGEKVMEVAVYPLATPIIAGPGAMLTIVLLMDNNRYSPTEQIITFAALATVLVGLLTIFLLGGILTKLLGTGMTNLLRRTMGLVLAALAVNLVLSAAATWLKLPEI